MREVPSDLHTPRHAGIAGSRRLVALVVLVAMIVLGLPPQARAAQVSEDIRFTASDGVSLDVTISGEAPLTARPVVVEFSPYGRGSRTLDPGPDYNFLLVQMRGTGDSDGSFDAIGPRTQKDVQEVLRWACEQEWSNGDLGLNGFSASAIAVYNSLHLDLPCVRGAVLKSGTFELYRDLIYPGGINNLVPAVVVLSLIGGIALAQSGERLERDPASSIDVARGQLETALAGREHNTLDSHWQERGFRGDVNDLPILMINGFFDVESRGAFQAFQELRDDGAHLMVIGAHDGFPTGTDGGLGASRRWLDRYVRGVPNDIEDEPDVQLWLADGSYEAWLDGDVVRIDGNDWPIPGTHWNSLFLNPDSSGSSRSLTDGSLTLDPPAAEATHLYPAVPSLPSSSDPPNTATVFPFLTDMALVEPLGLSYTTEPFATDVLSAGPASLELRLASTSPETGIWVVLSDVAPDGTAQPVASGRLLNSFPDIDEERSLRDPETGDIVQPYGVYDPKSPAAIGTERLYRIELWPIGNRFKAGHRLRLHVLGTSAVSTLGLPAANAVTVGGENPSRLLFPVLPTSDLEDALPS